MSENLIRNLSSLERVRVGKGFSLIELMIVVAVIGILAGIAYPSYTEYIVRSRRAAAEAYLMDLASRQQEYQLTARTYADDLADIGAATTPADVGDHYGVSFADPQPTVTRFVLQAVPSGAQASRDTKCGTLTINQAGVKTISGTGDLALCWGGK